MSNQGFRQDQRQVQTQTLAPQLRQSLKILQAPALELRNAILEELQTNPTLEELPTSDLSIESTGSENAEGEANTPDSSEELNLDENYEILNQLDEDLRELWEEENRQTPYTRESKEKREHLFDSYVAETSLQEHLIQQAELGECSEEQKEALNYLVGSLDDRGFLTAELSELAQGSNLSEELLEASLEILQSFDPPGIGSKDLQSCLLIQLKLQSKTGSLAEEIIRNYYPLLMRRRIPELAKATHTSIDEVQLALDEIALLDPAPGRRFSEDNNHSIQADIVVEKVDGEWVIHMNDTYLPKLRISSTYKELIAKGKLKAQEKEYIKDKIKGGKFLMNSIEQRQHTVRRIAEQLLIFQKDFFEHGTSKLHPLTMSQIAEVLELHETTISRAIANKYIKTPWGLFDLRYFFASGYQTTDGETLSNKSIKEMIAQIIQEESPKKPLSDQAIVKILADKDITIARRTVAKYREELGILATHLRKQYQ